MNKLEITYEYEKKLIDELLRMANAAIAVQTTLGLCEHFNLALHDRLDPRLTVIADMVLDLARTGLKDVRTPLFNDPRASVVRDIPELTSWQVWSPHEHVDVWVWALREAFGKTDATEWRGPEHLDEAERLYAEKVKEIFDDARTTRAA